MSFKKYFVNEYELSESLANKDEEDITVYKAEDVDLDWQIAKDRFKNLDIKNQRLLHQLAIAREALEYIDQYKRGTEHPNSLDGMDAIVFRGQAGLALDAIKKEWE